MIPLPPILLLHLWGLRNLEDVNSVEVPSDLYDIQVGMQEM